MFGGDSMIVSMALVQHSRLVNGALDADFRVGEEMIQQHIRLLTEVRRGGEGRPRAPAPAACQAHGSYTQGTRACVQPSGQPAPLCAWRPHARGPPSSAPLRHVPRALMVVHHHHQPCLHACMPLGVVQASTPLLCVPCGAVRWWCRSTRPARTLQSRRTRCGGRTQRTQPRSSWPAARGAPCRPLARWYI